MNESDFTSKLLRPNLPGYFQKIAAGPYQVAGLPDIIGVWKGQFVAIEVKAASGKLTNSQKYHLRQIQKAGGLAFEVRFDKECTFWWVRDSMENLKLLRQQTISTLSKQNVKEIFIAGISWLRVLELEQSLKTNGNF